MENSSISTSTPPLPPHSIRTKVPLTPTIAAALGTIVVVLLGGVAGFFAVGGPSANLHRLSVQQGLVVQLWAELPLVPYLMWIMLRIWKRTPAELGFRMPTWREAGIGVIGFAAMLLVVQGLSVVIQTLAHVQHQQAPVQLLKGIRQPGTLAFFVVFAIVIAPVIEELTFRVFLFNAAHSYWPFWPAAALSGLFFGFAHADPYAFAPLVLGGIVLCKVYDYTKNAWISMISHGLFNGTTIFALLALQQAGVK